QAMNRFADSIIAYYGSAQRHSFGVSASTAPMGQEALFQSVMVSKGDGEAMLQAYRDMIVSQSQVFNAFAGLTGQLTTVEVTPNAVTAGDVSFDVFKADMKFNADTPEGMQAQRALSMIYGPGGLGGYFGAVDDKLLIASGVPQQRLAEL